jgi:hypothetical protein
METTDRFTAALAEQTQRDNNQFTPPQQQFKQCTCCGKLLPIDKFYRAEHGKYGVEGQCKKCKCEKKRELILKKAGIKELQQRIAELESKPRGNLSTCEGRELIAELRRRGYHGELEYTVKIKV